MARAKVKATFVEPIDRTLPRRDTISPRTIVQYDPRAPRPTTPILFGQTVVARRRLPHQIYTEYLILDGAEVIGRQISYPSDGDVQLAVNRHRRRISASQIREASFNGRKTRSRRAKLREAA